MSKILVYLYDGMADFEVTFALHLLSGLPDWKLLSVAKEPGIVRSMSGLQYVAEAATNEVLQEEAEALLIPGGSKGVEDAALMELIRVMDQRKKLLAAICAGPHYLAKAGVLQGRRYTTSIAQWTQDHELRYGGKDPFCWEGFCRQRVVRDGNLITAQGFAFVDFSIEVCDWLGAFENAEEKAAFEKQTKGI